MASVDIKEYQVISVAANDLGALTSTLNTFGAEGWTVIAVLPLAGSAHTIYMTRDKK